MALIQLSRPAGNWGYQVEKALKELHETSSDLQYAEGELRRVQSSFRLAHMAHRASEDIFAELVCEDEELRTAVEGRVAQLSEKTFSEAERRELNQLRSILDRAAVLKEMDWSLELAG